jgi:flagellar biosynthetic protein FliR
MQYFVNNFQAFLLVLVRINAMIMIAPFFSSGVIPFRMKALLSFMVSLVVFPVISSGALKIPDSMGYYYLLVIQHALIGILIGFMISIIFTAFQLSGQYFAVQIGFGINEVLDPMAQVSVPLIGQLKNMIGLLLFLAISGHHFMIEAVFRSFELAPLFGLSQAATGGILKLMVHSFSGMFMIALKMALPVVATIFLVTVSMGVLAKVAPQMNIMMLGFPFKIIVAFAILVISAPLVIRIMRVALERGFELITGMLRNWPG